MSGSNYIKNVAVVGATGRQGKFIVEELLTAGKHNITVITRKDSPNTMPSGVTVARINYDDPATLIAALKNQDALVITMNSMVPADIQFALIDAAAAAEVPYIFPNEWSPPLTNETFGKETLLGPSRWAARKRIEELGKSAWIGMTTSFWYEYSLGIGEIAYGLDYKGRSMTFFDDGMQKMNTSTWPQCARAVRKLLSLPISSTDDTPSLSVYANKNVYISSFLLSQREMFDSVLRVTNAQTSDWTIKYENASERYSRAKKALEEGDRMGYIIMMYTRSFYKDGMCFYEEKLDNKALGLPVEDLDEFTKIAVERAEKGLR